jgi:hypothetical protein
MVNKLLRYLVLQMSCLDAFIILHFEEKDEFVRVTKKGLLLDKADYSEKGYMIDEQKYPWIPDKAASSTGKGKKKVNKPIDLSDDEEDEEMWKQPGETGVGDEGLEGDEDEEEEEAEVGGGIVPLEGAQLGETIAVEDHSTDLARTTFGGTPWMLFTPENPSDQLALMPCRHSKRPSQSSQDFSPLLPPNPQRKRKAPEMQIGSVPRMHLLPDKSETMQVASQAFVSVEEDTEMGTMKAMMKEMFSEFKTSWKKMNETILEQSRSHAALMEQQRRDMEARMEMQHLEMELRMDQQRKELTEYTQMSVNSVMTQVPQIVQGVLVGMGGYFNVQPLQFQGPATSQPALMLTSKSLIPMGVDLLQE